MGEVFAGRYELVDPIGRGGSGAVWRSWDHRRRRYVAAKVLQQSDAHALLRFVREQAMRIDHPHVLAPASWAADDDKVLFTMDLVHGGSLSHLIGDYGPLSPRYVCTLLDQLLSGLTAVHAEGVVHRDIKPANILLEATGTRRPRVRLSDFGIAMRKGEPRLTEPDYVVGTPGYFAPEQMLGAEPDFPADLYAVGLVALYLLSGRRPDSQAIVERYLREVRPVDGRGAYDGAVASSSPVPPAPQGVPEPLWQVVGVLLHPEPEARFRTATGARKALAAIVELLPETGVDDEPVEVFDHIGPLPDGFGPHGPVRGTSPRTPASRGAFETDGFPLQPPARPTAGDGPLAGNAPAVGQGRPGGQALAAGRGPAAGRMPAAEQSVALPDQPGGRSGAQVAAEAVRVPTERNPYATVPPYPAVPPPYAAVAPGHARPPDPTRPHTGDTPSGSAVPHGTGPARPVAPRTGPSARVVALMLVVALLCFAFGIWGLSAS